MMIAGIVVFCSLVIAGLSLMITQIMKGIHMEQDKQTTQMKELLIRVCKDVNLTDGKVWNDTKRMLREWDKSNNPPTLKKV